MNNEEYHVRILSCGSLYGQHLLDFENEINKLTAKGYKIVSVVSIGTQQSENIIYLQKRVDLLDRIRDHE